MSNKSLAFQAGYSDPKKDLSKYIKKRYTKKLEKSKEAPQKYLEIQS